MFTIKKTSILLLIVGVCHGLPQYPGQEGVDGNPQQQQGGLVPQAPVTSQCPSHQGCVPYFQCVDGYINTDGAGLLDLRLQPKGTCIEPDYPDIPGLCCNIPGIPEPPPPVEAPCPEGFVCTSVAECQDNNLLDVASPVVPFDVRLHGSGPTCGDSNIPGVCCATSIPTPSSPYSVCPGGEVCSSFDLFDTFIADVTDESADFEQCFIGQTSEVGFCYTPRKQGLDVCPVQSVCRPEHLCDELLFDNTGLDKIWSECAVDGNTNNPGVCCLNPGPKRILDVCPLQSVCMPETLCEDQIIDNAGQLTSYVAGGSWPGCAIDGNINNPGVCCINPVRITPEYPVADQCGIRNEEVSVLAQRIQSNIAYNEAQFGEFPWQAIIFSINYTFVCGASIIGDRWLVTAAHCVHSFTSNDITVRVGEWQVNTFDEPKPYLDVDVAAVTIHPQFNPRNVHNDIAVLELIEPLIFRYHINSICLPGPGQTFWGQRCIATGWGKDAFDGQYQHIMKKVDLPTVDHHQCQSLLQKTRLGKFYQLDDSFMCAGGEENTDACKGDGGGPLACQDPVSGRYVLTGITAFGIGCGTKDVPGVYADVQALLPFIQAVVGGTYDPNTFNQQQPIKGEALSGYGK